MTYGEFMAEEQQARIQAIKDSEFRAANDDGEPATDLAGVGPSSLSPPGVVHVTVEDEEFGEDFTVKVTVPDLLAAVRDGVESGTIEREVVWVCRVESFWTPNDTKTDYESYQKRLMDPDDETGDAGHYCSPFAAHYEGCGWKLLIPGRWE